jgi:hypothetical protein
MPECPCGGAGGGASLEVRCGAVFNAAEMAWSPVLPPPTAIRTAPGGGSRPPPPLPPPIDLGPPLVLGFLSASSSEILEAHTKVGTKGHTSEGLVMAMLWTRQKGASGESSD